MSEPRAVLWDLDGTLIDSEEFHWIAWRDTLANRGISVTRKQFLSSFGQRNDAIISKWLGTAATPDRIAEIANAKEQLYRDLIRKNGIPPLPGVAAWLRQLHEQEWFQAIASSAPRLNINAVLDTLGAAQYFEGIVSAEEVQRGKPDPEVYLNAASRVGTPPARCIVVEDAAAGIEGARRAGMRSIGVSRHGQPLPADIVVQSLDLLAPDAFERLLESVVPSLQICNKGRSCENSSIRNKEEFICSAHRPFPWLPSRPVGFVRARQPRKHSKPGCGEPSERTCR
jgi:beta-phosphoglucomutase